MEKLMKLAEQLSKRDYSAVCFATAEEAKAHILSEIKEGESVGIGGSMTVKSLGLDAALSERGNSVFWHWNAKPGEGFAMQKQAAFADVYLCSANAVTKDGILVNIDQFGNRLAGLMFGTGRVYVIAGKNKLVGNIEEALDRIKNVVAPQNARRLNLNTPCAKLGQCTDCNSPQRMCHATLLLERKPGTHPIEVVLVNEDLGY